MAYSTRDAAAPPEGRSGHDIDHPQGTAARHTRLAYLPGLDGLRAIAVLAVLLYHADLTWFQGGYLGVDVFFVLSGFLITSLLVAEWNKSGTIDLKQFWLRRARRLLPALFLLLGLCLAFAVIFLPDEVANLRNDALAAIAYVTNWYLIFSQKSYFETVGRPSLFQHLWSLAVEEQFYLLWPVILMLLLKFWRRSALPAVIFGALLSAAFMWLSFDPNVDPSRLYYGTDTRAASLLIGAVLALVLVPGKGRITAIRTSRAFRWCCEVAGVVALAGLFWCFVSLDETQGLVYQGGMQALEVATAVAILGVVQPGARIMPRLLGGRLLRWLGQRSYGIYLWHWPVFMVTRPGLDVSIDGAPLFVLRLAATLVLAELSYKYIETPVRNGSLGRAWADFRAGRRRHISSQGLRWVGATLAVLGFAILVAVPVVEARPPAPPDYLQTTSVNTIDPLGGADQGTNPGQLTVGDPSQSSDSPLPNAFPTDDSPPINLPQPTLTPAAKAPANTATPRHTATEIINSRPSPTPTYAATPSVTSTPTKLAPTRRPTSTPTALPTDEAVPSNTPTLEETPSLPVAVPTLYATATAVAEGTPTGWPTSVENLATATPATPQPTATPMRVTEPTEIASLGKISAIGDSVMLGAAGTLRTLGSVQIDAAVGRQVSTAITLLNSYHAKGLLGPVVIVHMGNNGTFSAKQFDQIMRILSDEKYVVFVNLKVPRSWEAPNNSVITQGVAKYPNAVLVDWRSASVDHPEYFAKDGFHLQTLGAKVYTNLIGETLRELASK